jgi:hypothetical protein
MWTHTHTQIVPVSLPMSHIGTEHQHPAHPPTPRDPVQPQPAPPRALAVLDLAVVQSTVTSAVLRCATQSSSEAASAAAGTHVRSTSHHLLSSVPRLPTSHPQVLVATCRSPHLAPLPSPNTHRPQPSPSPLSVVGLQLLPPPEHLTSYPHLSILAARRDSPVVAGGPVPPSISNLALVVTLGCRAVGLQAAATTANNSILPVFELKSCVTGVVTQGASPAGSQDCDLFLKKTLLCVCLLVVFLNKIVVVLLILLKFLFMLTSKTRCVLLHMGSCTQHVR